jgi:hypothetical protein
MRFDVVEGDRQREAFSNPVVSYRVAIFTSSRCSGFYSNKRYASYSSALKACERIENEYKIKTQAEVPRG